MTTTACQAYTKTGQPYQAAALKGSHYCFTHDPARTAERAAARAKGGHARHGRQVGTVVGSRAPVSIKTPEDVLSLLEQTVNDCLQLENSLNRARTLATLAMAVLRTIEGHELEQRIGALEALMLERKGER